MSRLDDELARLRTLVDDGGLADGTGLLGVELELHLIDGHARPALCNEQVLAHLAPTAIDVQPELARFNVEVNLPPVALTERPLSSVRDTIDAARRAASQAVPDVAAISIGTLPTLEHPDVTADALSDRGRYREIDAGIVRARGGSVRLTLDGDGTAGERLDVTLRSIALEAAATSLQVHLDLPGDGFPAAWNVAQAIAALQVAVAANSPTLLGRRLWHETRVPLFEQLIDARSPSERSTGAAGGAPPRVWFGDRWITHPADLFAENLAHFRAPLVAAAEERAPEDGDRLDELVLHNGTVWRWNRPVYALIGGAPTLRIENRVLSAPPSAADAAADTALFVGLVAGLRSDADLLTRDLAFADADRNFRTAARDGLAARLRWPGVAGTVPAAELLVDHLITVAADGLDLLGVPPDEASEALDIIAGRASEGRNGATWQLATLAEEELHHDRRTALQRMLLRYRDLQDEGRPVHRWPWPSSSPPR